MNDFSDQIPAVNDCKKTLNALQSSWDNLTLLCHLSGTGVNTGDTRIAFNELTDILFGKLSDEIVKKTVVSIRSKAQNAIDILTRNLYERTADIGFISGDDLITGILENSTVESGIVEYLKKYVETYTVYSNALVFDHDGACLCASSVVESIVLPEHVRKSAQTGRFEFFEALSSNEPKALFYCSPVRSKTSGGKILGYVALVFNHLDELKRIFDLSLSSDDWLTLSFVAEDDSVILSSDPYHIQASMKVKTTSSHTVTRLGVHEYLSLTCSATPFQGYVGCGWRAHAMIPLVRAFSDGEEDICLSGVNTDVLFDEALREIPRKSLAIQNALNRAVWNGSVQQGRETANNSFSKILLKEIGEAGQKTRDAFSNSISRLSAAVVSSVKESARSAARLSMEIVDRSLYERANDCRWWTRNQTFGDRTPGFEARLKSTLSVLNDLYTVYRNIVVFARDGSALASSRPLGVKRFHQDWVARCCNAKDYEYQVSRWEPCLDQEPGYVYVSPIFDREICIGGVALFFDSVPQLNQILHDTLPSNKGAFSLFVSGSNQVMASTSELHPVGSLLETSRIKDGVMILDGKVYLVEEAHSRGYREYNDFSMPTVLDRMRCFVFVQIGEPSYEASSSTQPVIRPVGDGAARIDIATFRSGQTWYGLASRDVIEVVPFRGLTASPGVSNLYYLMYGHAAIPVAAMKDSSSPSGDVIVLASQAHPSNRFGVLVDEVGSVIEVSASQIKEMPEIFGRSRSGHSSVLHTMNERNELIVILDASRLSTKFGFVPVAEPSAVEQICKSISLSNSEKDHLRSTYSNAA